MSAISPVDTVALSRWMDEQGVPRGDISGVERLSGGTQNILLRFRRAGESYVLRLPPQNKRPNSDDTMRREAKVLAGLASTDVPHPRLIAACGDETVLGSAFFVMEAVEGFNPTVDLPVSYDQSSEWRWQLGLIAVDGAAAVGNVDFEAAGLSGLGRAEGFLDRQVQRWKSQLAGYRELPGYEGSQLSGIEELGVWLDANRPVSTKPGLIHGDYHLANILCSSASPALTAIVDWELATIGDPLLDLGCLLATWPVKADEFRSPLRGLPGRDVLVARYSERSGRDLSAIDWYEVLAAYKLAIVLEGTYAMACAGRAQEQTGRRLHRVAIRLLERAVTRAGL